MIVTNSLYYHTQIRKKKQKNHTILGDQINVAIYTSHTVILNYQIKVQIKFKDNNVLVNDYEQ